MSQDKVKSPKKKKPVQVDLEDAIDEKLGKVKAPAKPTTKPVDQLKVYRSRFSKEDAARILATPLLQVVEAKFSPPEDQVTPLERNYVLYELALRRRGSGMSEMANAAAHLTGFNKDGLRRHMQELFKPEGADGSYDKPWQIDTDDEKVKVCPRCQFTVARDGQSIELLFGYRKVTPDNPTVREPYFATQTWCRWCRTLPKQTKSVQKSDGTASSVTMRPIDKGFAPAAERPSPNDFVPGKLSSVSRHILEGMGLIEKPAKVVKPKPEPKPKEKKAKRIRPEVDTSGKSSDEKAKAARDAAKIPRKKAKAAAAPE